MFEELRQSAEGAGANLELWYSPPLAGFARRGTSGHLPWARQLPVWTLPRRLGGLEWQHLPWRQVVTAEVMIVSDNVRVLSNLAVLVLRRLLGKPVLTWGHGVNFQPGPSSQRLACLRGWLLRLADRNLVYTSTCVSPMLALGFSQDRIVITENAIDSTAAAGLSQSHPEVHGFRARLGLGEAPCIAFLGSWYARKRPELVEKIGEILCQHVPNAKVLVIGGGDGLATIQQSQIPWLVCLGPLQGREKFLALASAKCLAITGVAGLNVLDAMAVGLPVVVPLRNDHSPEIEYVTNDVNGCIVHDSPENLAQACIRLCLDKSLHQRMSQMAKNTADKLTVERMAANILDQVKNLSDQRKLR